MSDGATPPPPPSASVSRQELLVVLATAWPAGAWFGVHLIGRTTESVGGLIQFVGALIVFCTVAAVGVVMAKLPRPAPLIRGLIGCVLGLVLTYALPGVVDGMFR
jgi:hypothetical protein